MRLPQDPSSQVEITSGTIATPGMILSHARAAGIVQTNVVRDWKGERSAKGRRRSAATSKITAEMALTGKKLGAIFGKTLSSSRRTTH
jgi:hypothetical protein